MDSLDTQVCSDDYRRIVSGSGLPNHCRVLVEQTDLFIASSVDVHSAALDIVVSLRKELTNYIERYPEFLTSFDPLPFNSEAPLIVQDMLIAAYKAGVGPMAAVAGAVAQRTGNALLSLAPEIIVENGGDVYFRTDTPQVFCILSEISDAPYIKVRIKESIPGNGMGICSSSGRIGPSFSFGKADIVSVVADDCAFADALATAMANRVHDSNDISATLQRALGYGAAGSVIFVDGQIGIQGNIEIVK
jgi:ApbE superfamily uncharacterized protein (UPF0280 family)